MMSCSATGAPSPNHGLVKVVQLRAALDNERSYSVPEEHDPSLLLLEGTHQLGVATLFTEPIVYMMATEVKKTRARHERSKGVCRFGCDE